METNSNYNDFWDDDRWVACTKIALVMFIILALIKILKMGYKIFQKCCWCPYTEETDKMHDV